MMKIFLLIFLFLLPAAAHAETLSLGGNWHVVSVRTDAERMARSPVTPDDPAYVGRTIRFAADAIYMEGRPPMRCDQPSVKIEKTTWEKLFAVQMGSRPSGLPDAEPKDYGLSVVPKAAVDVQWLDCRHGRLGPSVFDGHPDSWIVQTGSRTAVLGWFDRTLLVIEATSGNEKIQSSFDCRAAMTSPEKAICSSPDLAAADRSVADAYRKTVAWCAGDAGKLRQLAALQSEWRRSRDRCGYKSDCLMASMLEQVNVLNAIPAAIRD